MVRSVRLLLAVLATGGLSGVGAGQAPIRFSEATPSTGISFRHTDGSSGRRYIVETVASGLATFDYDGDGLVDIYFLNGAPLPGSSFDRPPTNALYRNLGNFRFADVTELAGVGDPGYGLGVAVGDYDNDGHPDLYLNNFGPNVLYRNQGDGTFRDVTAQAGVGDGQHVGAGTCLLDCDADGHLDLYVGHYVRFSFDRHRPHFVGGVPVYGSPVEYGGDPDALYHNQADGTFRDISEASGIAAHAGTAMGMVAGDFDNDGDTDVFIANDRMANFLFRNDGHGRFAEVALECGAACNAFGAEMAGMGVDCGDYNRDGWLDLFLTNYKNEWPVLYENHRGMFEDVTMQVRAGQGGYQHINWGCGLVDFDNDGDLDLFMANGHLNDNIEQYDDTGSYHAANVLLRNDGGRFVDVSQQAGDGLAVKLSSRGAAFEDLDNDGLVDVVVLNSRREPTLLRNQTRTEHHWVGVRLRGVKTNRDGVGARVKVVAGDLVQIAEVHSGRGYQSQWGTRLHFGLGHHNRIDQIEVRWLGGGTDRFTDLPTKQVITLTEGTGSDR